MLFKVRSDFLNQNAATENIGRRRMAVQYRIHGSICRTVTLPCSQKLRDVRCQSYRPQLESVFGSRHSHPAAVDFRIVWLALKVLNDFLSDLTFLQESFFVFHKETDSYGTCALFSSLGELILTPCITPRTLLVRGPWAERVQLKA
jgi:hypothetical protein